MNRDELKERVLKGAASGFGYAAAVYTFKKLRECLEGDRE